MKTIWHRHPHIARLGKPPLADRAADKARNALGSWTYLIWQTILVAAWITLNLVAYQLRWDPYPFILLNLAFSTQAAYAAPLILLSQKRQDAVASQIAVGDYRTDRITQQLICEVARRVGIVDHEINTLIDAIDHEHDHTP